MQPVNDDMEDLFRRAAEGYPLISDGANFNKISGLLGEEAILPEKKEKKRRFLWLLFLFIPLAFCFGYYYATHRGIGDKHNNNNIAFIKDDKKKVRNGNPPAATDTLAPQVAAIDDNKKQVAVAIKSNQPIKTQPSTTTSVIHPDKNNQFSQANNTYTTSSNNHKINTNNKGRNNQLTTSKNTIDDKLKTNDETIVGSSKSRKAKKYITDTLLKEDTKYLNKNTANPLPPAPAKENVLANQEKNTTDSLHKTEPAKKLLDSSAISITKLSKKPVDTTTSNKAINKSSTRAKSSIYIGIVGGLDASTVKSNKASKAGYNIGFVAGYNTGRHLRFETGILWNDKKYYSDGSHVAVEKLALQPHSQIVYMDGTCSMIEIPVSIQYHFNTTGKHTWYAGTGLSSYIMKKEGYHYLYRRYNVEYYSQKEYTNSTTNWLSVLQLNIGYQVKINKAVNLRIEPYAKLPLQGLGIGKLPLSSVGVNAGFTLPIH